MQFKLPFPARIGYMLSVKLPAFRWSIRSILANLNDSKPKESDQKLEMKQSNQAQLPSANMKSAAPSQRCAKTCASCQAGELGTSPAL